MNPSHSLQVTQLAHAFKHAGGWGKLGWHMADLMDDEDLLESGLEA